MGNSEHLSVKGFIESSFVDWQGKICSVLFLPNCNFRCSYCHNADLVLRPGALEDISFDYILKRLDDLKEWVDGVCITGGEPTIHPFLPRLLAAIKQEGFLVKLDTNGSHPEVLSSLIENGLVDYVAMDIKSSLVEEAYQKVTGVRNIIYAVRESINTLLKGAVEYEFRFTVVPCYHSPDDIYYIATELNGAARLRLQNFNPAHTLDPLLNTSHAYPHEDISAYQQKVDQILSIKQVQ